MQGRWVCPCDLLILYSSVAASPPPLRPFAGFFSGSVAACERFLTHRGHRALHEPSRRLRGDAEGLADLAVAALAAVGEAEALLDRGAGSIVEHAEQVAH